MMEMLILGALLVLYVLFSMWESRRDRLREYTHAPDIYNMRMLRVCSDEEGRKKMEEDSK